MQTSLPAGGDAPGPESRIFRAAPDGTPPGKGEVWGRIDNGKGSDRFERCYRLYCTLRTTELTFACQNRNSNLIVWVAAKRSADQGSRPSPSSAHSFGSYLTSMRNLQRNLPYYAGAEVRRDMATKCVTSICLDATSFSAQPSKLRS